MQKRLVRLICLCFLLISAGSVFAQNENLLQNPSFEDGFSNVTVTGRSFAIANGWQIWTAPRADDMPSFQNVQPTYFAASDGSSQGALEQVRSGSDAQAYFSFFETHDAGIYQQITGVTPGTELRFSIYGYVVSTSFDDLSRSEADGGVALRVGIDPTGGTDALASTVIYPSEAAIFYDAYRQYSVIATAQSSTVTVFVRTSVSEPVQFSYVYLDDAVLEVTPQDGEITPVPTEEVLPTNTATSTATNTPTATVTATATLTDTPTETSTATETEDVPTREGPTETPTETATATEEIVIEASNTATATTTTTATNTSTATTTATATNTPTATVTPNVDTDVLAAFPGRILHTVQAGDTVSRLAERYGSSIAAIMHINGLNSSAVIYRGQGLIIPVRIVPSTETPTATPLVIIVTATPDSGGTVQAGTIYIVQPGDTLSGIAIRFNTTVSTLMQLNGITNPNRIFWGLPIKLPVAPSVETPVTPSPTPETNRPTRYVVQPGDTLYRLAILFNVSIADLANENNLSNWNFIWTGQVLRIPQE